MACKIKLRTEPAVFGTPFAYCATCTQVFFHQVHIWVGILGRNMYVHSHISFLSPHPFCKDDDEIS